MKKIITLIFVFMFLVMPVKAYADSTTVEVKVNGEVKKGSTIEILVNVKDVEKFYAASVDFTYDTNQLKVESIVASDFITKYSNDIMELGGETDKNGNTASYSFTFLGEKNGIKGSGTLAIITAQVLNNGKLSIGQDTMKVKLVQRVGDTVENYSYKFNGYNTSATTDTSGSGNNSQNAGDSTNSEDSTENNESGSVNNDSNSSTSTTTDSNSKNSVDSSKEDNNEDKNYSTSDGEESNNENLVDEKSDDATDSLTDEESVAVNAGANSSVDKDNITANGESSVTTKNKEIIIGIVIYNEIIIVNFCGLDVNTDKEIKYRALSREDNRRTLSLFAF